MEPWTHEQQHIDCGTIAHFYLQVLLACLNTHSFVWRQ